MAQVEIRRVNITGSDLESLKVRRDARSRGFLYALTSPSSEVTLIAQSAASLATAFSMLIPWRPALNRASLHFALHHSTSYRQWLLECASIDSGEGTAMLHRRLMATAKGRRVFIVARIPGVYSLALGRPREHRLSRSDVEIKVRLRDDESLVSRVSNHSNASTVNVVAPNKRKSHGSKSKQVGGNVYEKRPASTVSSTLVSTPSSPATVVQLLDSLIGPRKLALPPLATFL